MKRFGSYKCEFTEMFDGSTSVMLLKLPAAFLDVARDYLNNRGDYPSEHRPQFNVTVGFNREAGFFIQRPHSWELSNYELNAILAGKYLVAEVDWSDVDHPLCTLVPIDLGGTRLRLNKVL